MGMGLVNFGGFAGTEGQMVMARRLLGIVAASAISVTAATSYTGTVPYGYSIAWSPPLARSNLGASDTSVIGDVFSAGRGFVRSSRAVYTVSDLALNVEHLFSNYEVFSQGLGFRV